MSGRVTSLVPAGALTLLEWREAIQRALVNGQHDDPAAHLSHCLRALMDVEARVLDAVPLNLVPNRTSPKQILSYLEKQFHNWKASKDKDPLLCRHLPELGLRDQAHLAQLLHYFVEAVSMEALGNWLRTYFGRLTSLEAAHQARRFLAVRMANALLPFHRGLEARHRPVEKIKQQLGRYAERESALIARVEDSPHFAFFLQPFLDHLQAISEPNFASGRPSQPGDRELLELVSRRPDLSLS